MCSVAGGSVRLTVLHVSFTIVKKETLISSTLCWLPVLSLYQAVVIERGQLSQFHSAEYFVIDF